MNKMCRAQYRYLKQRRPGQCTAEYLLGNAGAAFLPPWMAGKLYSNSKALLSGLLLLLAVTTPAAISQVAESPSRTPELAAGSVLAQVLFGLGSVTAAIFALAWLTKRLGGARLMQHNCMDIVASMPVGSREKLLLVKVDNTKILLGVTSSTITRLHVFDSDPQVAAESDDGIAHPLQDSAETSPSDAVIRQKQPWDFARHLKQFSGGLVSGSGLVSGKAEPDSGGVGEGEGPGPVPQESPSGPLSRD